MGSSALPRCGFPVAALASVAAMFVLLSSVASTAAPWSSETTVSGSIEDMWLDDDRCYFRIAISWSATGALVGESVDAIASFLNESTGRYDQIPSSQGWQTGDEFNATLKHWADEFSESYRIELLSKSDENYAEPLSYFERNPFIFYLLLIVALFISLQVLLFLVMKRRGGKGRYEGPDYIQYRRRI